ncbi:hypothetical protein [Saccharolobus islandicus]|nr:hypothetical protein [Sulfolobus islandicus]WCM37662.1 hypothetical protein GO599_09465 [Sulfolobus islandicus]
MIVVDNGKHSKSEFFFQQIRKDRNLSSITTSDLVDMIGSISLVKLRQK